LSELLHSESRPDLSTQKMRQHRNLSQSACAILIAVHALLLVLSARSNSVTFDEYAHLPSGVAYWKYGWRAFPLFNLTPPLLRLVAATPVVIAGAEAPSFDKAMTSGPRNRHWNYGEVFLRANAPRYQHLFVIARIGLIPLSCLGLWIAWKLAGELHGPSAAIAAATLWAFEPDLLAHGSVVGTDMGTAVAIIAASWLWWRFCGRGSARNLVIAALVIAIAQLCKFTSLVLFPMMVAIAICRIIEGTIKWQRVLIGFAVAVAISWFAINATYGFHGTFTPFGSHPFESLAVQSIQHVLPSRMPSLLPQLYLEGFDLQTLEIEAGMPGYFLGHAYEGARWNFYPVALAAKLPVAAIVLLLCAVASLFVTKPRAREGAVYVAMLIAACAMWFARVNIGIRYLLPLYPFAIILISRLWKPNLLRGRPNLLRALAAPAATSSAKASRRSILGAIRDGLLVMMIAESLARAHRFELRLGPRPARPEGLARPARPPTDRAGVFRSR
jgi:hypothetical protein